MIFNFGVTLQTSQKGFCIWAPQGNFYINTLFVHFNSDDATYITVEEPPERASRWYLRYVKEQVEVIKSRIATTIQQPPKDSDTQVTQDTVSEDTEVKPGTVAEDSEVVQSLDDTQEYQSVPYPYIIEFDWIVVYNSYIVFC